MKRIFMLSNHPVFGEGVEILLRQQAEVEFVGRESNPDLAIERIKELRPDVVIVDHGCSGGDAGMMVMRILREHTQTKVIGLDLKENTFCIYQEEQRVVRGVDDLRNALGIEDNSKWVAATC
jgi:DNA-binding NarL/FixJ family response regulator